MLSHLGFLHSLWLTSCGENLSRTSVLKMCSGLQKVKHANCSNLTVRKGNTLISRVYFEKTSPFRGEFINPCLFFRGQWVIRELGLSFGDCLCDILPENLGPVSGFRDFIRILAWLCGFILGDSSADFIDRGLSQLFGLILYFFSDMTRWFHSTSRSAARVIDRWSVYDVAKNCNDKLACVCVA